MQAAPRHQVLQLWVRPASGEPPEVRDELALRAGEGIVGDHAMGGKRHVTLIFQEDWNVALLELGMVVPPVARRANVLLSGGRGTRWIGKQMRVGDCLLEILDETRPCGLMEKTQAGLRKALEPEGRGGVWGRILEGGLLKPGDRAERHAAGP